MKKITKQTKILIAVVIPFLLIGILCVYSTWFCISLSFSPGEQPDTEWISHDGTIRLYVEDYREVNGYIENGDEKVTFRFIEWLRGIVYVSYNHLESEYSSMDEYDVWDATFWTPNFFTIRIHKSDTFQEGEVIKFRKVKQD